MEREYKQIQLCGMFSTLFRPKNGVNKGRHVLSWYKMNFPSNKTCMY